MNHFKNSRNDLQNSYYTENKAAFVVQLWQLCSYWPKVDLMHSRYCWYIVHAPDIWPQVHVQKGSTFCIQWIFIQFWGSIILHGWTCFIPHLYGVDFILCAILMSNYGITKTNLIYRGMNKKTIVMWEFITSVFYAVANC